MEILSFEGGAQAPRKKKSLGLILGVAIVAGVTTLGSTLAASVTIGSAPITFGQGVAQAVACDSEITVTPATEFVNSAGAGAFRLKSITVSGLNTAATNSSTGVGCAEKNLIIRVYGNDSSTALTMFATDVKDITSTIKATVADTTVPTGVTKTTTSATAATGSVTYIITTPTLNAADIFKITVEQQN
jgi:hypothetical protein